MASVAVWAVTRGALPGAPLLGEFMRVGGPGILMALLPPTGQLVESDFPTELVWPGRESVQRATVLSELHILVRGLLATA